MPGTPPPHTQWSQQIFDFIWKHSQALKEVANSGAIGGISAAALAGAMAKECHGVLSNPEDERKKDRFAMKRLRDDSGTYLSYSLVKALDLIDQANSVR